MAIFTCGSCGPIEPPPPPAIRLCLLCNYNCIFDNFDHQCPRVPDKEHIPFDAVFEKCTDHTEDFKRVVSYSKKMIYTISKNF